MSEKEVLTVEDRVLGKVSRAKINKGKSTNYLSSNHLWEVENKKIGTGKSILDGYMVSQMLNSQNKDRVLIHGEEDISYNGFSFKYLRKAGMPE